MGFLSSKIFCRNVHLRSRWWGERPTKAEWYFQFSAVEGKCNVRLIQLATTRCFFFVDSLPSHDNESCVLELSTTSHKLRQRAEYRDSLRIGHWSALGRKQHVDFKLFVNVIFSPFEIEKSSLCTDLAQWRWCWWWSLWRWLHPPNLTARRRDGSISRCMWRRDKVPEWHKGYSGHWEKNKSYSFQLLAKLLFRLLLNVTLC